MASMVMAAPPDDERLRNLLEVSREEGWAAFLRKFEGVIRFRIAFYRFSPSDSEDVFQEVCLRLARDDSRLLRAWDPSRCPLFGYLGVITTSVCLSFLKSGYYAYNRRRVSLSEPGWGRWERWALLEDPAPTPEERLSRMERLGRIESLLEHWMNSQPVSGEDRLLIHLRLGGMSYREVAEALDISIACAKVRFCRLKKELAAFLLGTLPKGTPTQAGRRGKSRDLD